LIVHDLRRAAVAEFVGTALLLIAVVGSGIAAERLFDGQVGLALLANAIATGGALIALILAFGPISGAQFNPVVTLAAAARGQQRWRAVPAYVLAQGMGAVAGVWLAHAMFALPVLQLGNKVREGAAQFLAETIATFGLLVVIFGCRGHRHMVVPYAVAAYITGAYWFTSSTSFANPAVTLARALTVTFAGIRLEDVLPFVVAQCVGAALATILFGWLERPAN
jgi:glycerol uptake facilitator-like aquaporin